MYDFAKKIGGDKVEVINLVPAGTEPHDWEPSTKDLIEMEKSDIFIYNGAGMEQWVDDVLESLDTEELTSVEASKGIKLLKDQDAHEHDHEHNSENDPHVWLDPQNAKYEMNKIKKALIKVDAENKDYYEANYKRYAKECDKLDTLYKEETSKLTKKYLPLIKAPAWTILPSFALSAQNTVGHEPSPWSSQLPLSAAPSPTAAWRCSIGSASFKQNKSTCIHRLRQMQVLLFFNFICSSNVQCHEC